MGTLLDQCHSLKLLVSAGVLLLCIMKLIGQRQVSHFGHARRFVPRSFSLLSRVITSFRAVIAAPGVLARIGDFIGRVKRPRQSHYVTLFNRTVAGVRRSRRTDTALTAFPRFREFNLASYDVTDTTHGHCLILASSLQLATRLRDRGVSTVGFGGVQPLN